jgi:AcrR family transcriptional regulator
MGAVIEHDVATKDRYDLAIERLPLTPRQARSVRTVRSMLIVTDQMIDRDGFDRFTTADVAAAAGVSIGIVYRYFADRVAILDALYPDRYALLRPGALEAHDAEVKAQALEDAYDEWHEPYDESTYPAGNFLLDRAAAIRKEASRG